MKKLTIARGPPGAGKTTLARNITIDEHNKGLSTRCVCSDDFFNDEFDNYKFDIKRMAESHAWCRAEVLRAMRSGTERIIIHNNFGQLWEYAEFILLAELADYEWEILEIPVRTRAELKTCLERTEHPQPFDIVASRWVRWYEDDRAIMVGPDSPLWDNEKKETP